MIPWSLNEVKMRNFYLYCFSLYLENVIFPHSEGSVYNTLKSELGENLSYPKVQVNLRERSYL